MLRCNIIDFPKTIPRLLESIASSRIWNPLIVPKLPFRGVLKNVRADSGPFADIGPGPGC